MPAVGPGGGDPGAPFPWNVARIKPRATWGAASGGDSPPSGASSVRWARVGPAAAPPRRGAAGLTGIVPGPAAPPPILPSASALPTGAGRLPSAARGSARLVGMPGTPEAPGLPPVGVLRPVGPAWQVWQGGAATEYLDAGYDDFPPGGWSSVLAPARRPGDELRGRVWIPGRVWQAATPPPPPAAGLTTWDIGQCHCPPCVSTICVVECSSIPVFGALVSVLSGGVTIGTCTTTASGCCAITIPSAGTYTVTVTIGGTVTYSGSRSLSCGGSVRISLPNTNLVCCGGYAIPYNLTLTDAVGSLSFVYYPSYFYPIWYGGHAVNQTSCTVSTPGGTCVSNPPSFGPVRVCYQMICYAGQAPTFAIQRAWSWVYGQGTLTPIWYQDPSGFTPGLPCATAPPASCGSPLTDTASFGADPISPSPFVLTGTPAPAGSNATADPVGGLIVISA